MYVGEKYHLDDITEGELYNHFRYATNSAAAMDGWHPKEFSYLSRHICKHIAILLNQIEKAPLDHFRPGTPETYTLRNLEQS